MDQQSMGQQIQSPPDLHAEARERLIVALDFPSAAEALGLVDQLEGCCGWCKVGLELYLGAGPSVIERLQARGLKVFLDLKLHDIPNTVASAIRSVSTLGASLLTVHAAGGPAMLRAAAEAAAAVSGAPQLLAVTVLTSMDRRQLAATGLDEAPVEQVLRLARIAWEEGIRGMVCSPLECAPILTRVAPGVRLVVPGVRPAGEDEGDQSRVGTPGMALGSGASMLVVGRPITRVANPAAAAAAILSEMETALALRPRG